MNLVILSLFLSTWGQMIRGGEHWGYEDTEDDPDHWCHFVESCCGEHQSPINFDKPTEVTNLQKFTFHDYNVTPSTMNILNNGHTVIVYMDEDDVTPRISGGGLDGDYLFCGFHFHWGNDSKRGSEHTLNGFRYAMEMHIVHYKSTYNSVVEAVLSNDPLAIAVLGVWFRPTSGRDNPAFSPVTDFLEKVEHNGQSAILPKPFPLTQIMPQNTKVFFRYMGSLTTPTCNEEVTWTVFASTLRISENQDPNPVDNSRINYSIIKMGSGTVIRKRSGIGCGLVELKKFRNLYFTHDDEIAEHLVNNFRPPQHLHGRRVSYVITS